MFKYRAELNSTYIADMISNASPQDKSLLAKKLDSNFKDMVLNESAVSDEWIADALNSMVVQDLQKFYDSLSNSTKFHFREYDNETSFSPKFLAKALNKLGSDDLYEVFKSMDDSTRNCLNFYPDTVKEEIPHPQEKIRIGVDLFGELLEPIFVAPGKYSIKALIDLISGRYEVPDLESLKFEFKENEGGIYSHQDTDIEGSGILFISMKVVRKS